MGKIQKSLPLGFNSENGVVKSFDGDDGTFQVHGSSKGSDRDRRLKRGEELGKIRKWV